jgi:RimJ/RimL family protein N-acetyltransferase
MATEPPAPFIVHARDGTRLLIRAVSPERKGRFAEGLANLSERSRYLRFAQPLQRFTDAELSYLTEIDYRDHMAWAAVALDEPGMPSVAVGRYIRRQDDATCAEVAVVVLDAYQGRRIGPLLLDALATTALANGIERFEGDILAHNETMLKVARRLGVTVKEFGGGVVHFEAPLPLVQEAASEAAQSGALPDSR